MKLLDGLHQDMVGPRRAQRLAQLLSEFIPLHSTVLDVGSGDGLIASLLLKQRPELTIQGVDVLLRPGTSIPVTQFDGKTLPYEHGTFDVVLFVDVLHHTRDPLILLKEAVRVARKSVVLKDHVLQGLWASARLRFMDRVGNARHGVSLPFNYWSAGQWRDAEQMLGLTKMMERRELKLYPWPAEVIFGAGLHFMARYDVPRSQ
jgi:SAM-dependent methyltransferase